MITQEMINANPTLSALSSEAQAAIIEMSTNDENTVIGAHTGRIHGQYEQDVTAITGLTKPDGMKAYDFVKQALNSYKDSANKAKELKASLEAERNTVVELKAKLADKSGDEVLKQQLTDAQGRVKDLQSQLQSEKDARAADKVAFEKRFVETQLNAAIAEATAGFKFKDGITEPVQKALINQAKLEMLTKGSPEVSADGAIVFRDANGQILNNPATNANPFTVAELLQTTSIKDVITSESAQGSGSRNQRTPGSAISISGARSQIEADDIIRKSLFAEGLTADSKEFQEKFDKVRDELGVANLPIF